MLQFSSLQFKLLSKHADVSNRPFVLLSCLCLLFHYRSRGYHLCLLSKSTYTYVCYNLNKSRLLPFSTLSEKASAFKATLISEQLSQTKSLGATKTGQSSTPRQNSSTVNSQSINTCYSHSSPLFHLVIICTVW